MKSPGISVITPVFNGGKYIASCLENVASQGCECVEHIVIDGGSGDETIKIVERYLKYNSHIRFVSERDNGQSEAMNKGLRLARGEVVGFLNVDDFYEAGTLNRVQNVFKNLQGPSLAVANCNILDGDDCLIGVNRPRDISLLGLIKGKEYPFNPSSYFYHKSIHDLVGFYDEREHYVMDLDFLLRAVDVANVQYFNETWGNFRWIEGTKTFVDARRGLMSGRSESLRLHYYKKLSFFEKMKVFVYRTKIRVLKILRRLSINFGKK